MSDSSQSMATRVGNFIKGFGDGMQNGNHTVTKEEFIIMQSTGMRDIKGIEIFDGDIISYPADDRFYMWVSYDETKGMFVANNKSFWGTSPELRIWNSVCEIVGNIYQNPEFVT